MQVAMPLLTIALAFVAAIWDVAIGRIPNALVAVGTAVAFAAAAVTAGVSGVWHSAVGMALALAVMLVPFALGWLGGGDVKLLAALGAYVAWPHAIELVLATALAGGALAVVWVTRGAVAAKAAAPPPTDGIAPNASPVRPRPLPSGLSGRSLGSLPTMPYAVAMAVGATVTVLAPAWLR